MSKRAVSQIAESLAAQALVERGPPPLRFQGRGSVRLLHVVDQEGKPTGRLASHGDVLAGVAKAAEFDLAVQDDRRPVYIVCADCPPNSKTRLVKVKAVGVVPTYCRPCAARRLAQQAAAYQPKPPSRDEEDCAAAAYFEERRWPNGVACPSCGSTKVTRGSNEKRRRQLWYCHTCPTPFSVTSGTIMHATKLPLHKWLLAYRMLQDGSPSGHQLAKAIGVSYKTAFFLMRLLRAHEPWAEFTPRAESDASP